MFQDSNVISQAPATPISRVSGRERPSSLALAAALYVLLLIAFWFAALHFNMP